MQEESKEKFYEKILESYYGTILAIDATGKVVYVNEKVLINTKDITKEEILGKPMQELVAEGYYNPSPSLEALRTKQPVTRELEGRMVLPLITTSIPIFDQDGEVEYVAAFSQDMTFVGEMLNKINLEKSKVRRIIDYASGVSSNSRIIAESKEIKKILAYLDTVARSDSTVMLYGESGTGKEVMAQHIFLNSHRNEEVYLPVNCAALPVDLIESELFGYEKGAFTGALKDGKVGLFELADKGTIFLDEIGEMPLLLQSKLLRVLENGEVKRIGGGKIKNVDVRIIAATNKDLQDMVRQKLFREDLYYRLNVVPVKIPPVRDRKEDIFPLCYAFLDEFNQKYGRSKIFSLDAHAAFESYDWPGNVREIRNVIERLYITSTEDVISVNNASILLPSHHRLRADEREVEASVRDDAEDYYDKPYCEAMLDFERRYIQHALEANSGNVSTTARRLNISRSALYYKLKKLGIQSPLFDQGETDEPPTMS